MKRLFFCLMAMFFIASCTKSDDVDTSGGDNGGGSQNAEITLSASSVSIAADATSGTISFTSTTAWTAEVTEGEEWCTIEPNSGNAGSAKITVKVPVYEERVGRSAKVIISAGKLEEVVDVFQRAISPSQILEKEREALVALYKATDGDNWSSNDNWCSDKPVSEWYGISVDESGNISQIRLYDKNLNGHLPKELGELQNLVFIDIRENCLTGRIPSEIMELPWWQKQWGLILPQQEDYGFSSEGIEIYAPQFSMTSLSGKTVSNSIFAENDYTVLYYFNDGSAASSRFTPKLIKLYEWYKNRGLGVFSATWQRSNIVQAYANSHNIPWEILIEPENRSWYQGTFANYYAQEPFVAVFDTTGRVVFNSALRDYSELPDFLNEVLGAPDYYESTDFSKDGEVKRLQTATKGDGIDIVLMGDAYSDRLVADGTYDNTMNTAMEKFFEVEPYKSFRDYFNVYSVTAVSQNEVYSDATSTIFEGYFGERTHVGGNNEKVFDYATKAISEELIDEALIVVMMNSPDHAGTCHMYGPSEGDWGDGASISYFPVGLNDEALAQVLHHEAGGHGFAKLGDEYAYQENGTIPGSEIADAQNMATYGWWKNVDFTNDPTAVKWSHFLSDARYASEGLGVYEGAYTYWSGAFRPTQNSIMNTNVGGFNAPSREAIYYRIHKLAYGSSWQYDYEEFVEWDAKNRVTSSATRGVPYRLDIPDNFQPTHPPVVIKKSWREAMNK